MARKSAKPKESKRKRNITKADQATLSFMEEQLATLYPNSNDAEARAFASYIEATHKLMLADAKVDDSRLDDLKYVVSQETWDEIQRRQRIMFIKFDAWMRMTKHRITVPVAEIKNIIVDALKASKDALPHLASLTGPEHRREYERLSESLLEALRDTGVAVREQEQEVPYCDPCTEELAA